LTFVQSFALIVISVTAVFIAIVSVLLLKRIARLIDEATVTLQSVSRLTGRLESFIDKTEKELAAVREITTRLSDVSERIEAVTEEAVGTVRQILHPIQILTGKHGVLHAALSGVLAGVAALLRRRDRSQESRDRTESTSSHPPAGERSAT
jgi:DNA repair ATPase RecN